MSQRKLSILEAQPSHRITKELSTKKLQNKSDGSSFREHKRALNDTRSPTKAQAEIEMHSEQAVMSPAQIERSIEQNIGAIALNANFGSAEEINRLLRQIALSHQKNQKNTLAFFLPFGFLRGARFELCINDQKLSISVHQASDQAIDLIKKHHHLLTKRLNQRGIILHQILFPS